MTKKTQTLIVLFALSACLGLRTQALAQRSATSTLPNSGPKVELVASTNPIFIDDVRFEGLHAVTASDVEREFREHLAGLTRDALFVPANAQKGASIIDRMLSYAGFMNAHVDVRIENVSAKRIRVTFVVDEGPPAVIREIKFVGNKVFSDDELLGHLELVAEMSHDVLDRATLEYDLDINVCNFMRSRGYLQAKILEPKYQSLNGNVSVIIPVEEGRLYRIGEITVSGSRRVSPEQIVEIIGVKKGDIADGKRIGDALFDELQSLYANMGYVQYAAEADPAFRDNPDVENEGIVDFQISIDEGACYKIGLIEFDDNKKLTEPVLRQFLLFKEGDTYNQQLIRDSINSLTESGLVQPIDREADVDYLANDETHSVAIFIRIREL